MSIKSLSTYERVVYTSHKYLVANPEIKWTNRYDFIAHAPQEDGITFLSTVADMLRVFEKNIHLNTVRLDYITVSTYVEDSKPYDGNEFLTIPIDDAGIRQPNTDPLPLTVVLSLQRSTLTGFPGKLFYRGTLEEGDIISVGGYPRLYTLADWETRIAEALVSSDLDATLSTGDNVLKMCVGKQIASDAQLVTAFSRPKVTFNKTKRRPKIRETFTA